MRFRIHHLLGLTAIVACVCWSVAAIRYSMTTRTIVSEDLSNGTRIRVIQDSSGEPFNTSIYFDDGDGRWRWYYYTHEDWYWDGAKTQFTNGRLHIRKGARSIVLDTRSGECATSGPGLFKRVHKKSTVFRDLPREISAQ